MVVPNNRFTNPYKLVVYIILYMSHLNHNNNYSSNSNPTKQIQINEQHFEHITRDIQPYIVRHLRSIPADNLNLIIQFVTEVEQEKGIQKRQRENLLQLLKLMHEFCPKYFREWTRDDIVAYLNKFRKNDSADKKHRWIGTYNVRLYCMQRFFRWLYYPEIEAKDRPTPAVMARINKIRRKEESGYDPVDLWTAEDLAIFLKYCPSKKYKAIVAIALDLSARPSEYLSVKIKDVLFNEQNGKIFATLKVSGKTGERVLPLYSSIAYLKDWINEHPQGTNPEAYLFSSDKVRDVPISAGALNHQINRIYKKGHKHSHSAKYAQGYFVTLLQTNIPQEDKKKISALLIKPWNPYVWRHSSLTQKARILNEGYLKQHAGWKKNSIMITKYLHFFNDESSKALLQAYGVIPQTKEQEPLQFKPKFCPNCGESNRPEASFCSNTKCRFVLSFQALEELRRQEKQEKIDQEDLIRKIVEERLQEKYGSK